MSYAQNNPIAAADINGIIGGQETPWTLNNVWAVGNRTAGYGQTAIGLVNSTWPVAASNWATVVNTTANIATHQGTSITAVTAPVSGGTISYLSAIPNNVSTVYTNRLNAATQGASVAYPATCAVNWIRNAFFNHTVSFTSGDAARYFFNAGGQLKLTFSHPNTTAGINLLFNTLASQCGTVVFSAPSTGTATIAGITYSGVTVIGGSGNAPTISASSGYYAMQTTATPIFYKQASSGPSGYLGTFIRTTVNSNGTQGANGDSGSQLTFSTTWDEVPDGLNVVAGSVTTLTVVPPESTNIANTWGAITVTSWASAS